MEDLRRTLGTLRDRFAGLVWVPGNHDLWTPVDGPERSRGEERYALLVEVCRAEGVLTPEDPYPVVDDVVVAPLFLLYDYSFRSTATKEEALELAARSRAFGADERLLHPDPHESREAWCHARVALTERRLEAVDPARRTVLVGHWALRHDVVRLPLVPAYAPWCGTTLTEDWHVRFRAAAVVFGHLHVPGTLFRDGVPFVEASLGYPRQWRRRALPPVPRQVWPWSPPPP